MDELIALISQKFDSIPRRRIKGDVNAVDALLNEDFSALYEHDEKNSKAIMYVMKCLDITNAEELIAWAERVDRYAQGMAERFRTGQDNEAFTDLMNFRDKTIAHDYTFIAVVYRFINLCPEYAFDGQMMKYLETVQLYKAERLQRAIVKTFSEEAHELPEEITGDLRELKMRIANTQNALDREKARNDTYREEIETLKASAEKDAMTKIFARMNSRSTGKLLDQFASARSYIAELESQGREIPAELRSLVVCVKSFMNFLQDSGVNMLHSVGDTLSINLAESEDYDYTGSDFDDYTDRKNVRVRNPGWSCNGIVFSIPSVYEIREN